MSPLALLQEGEVAEIIDMGGNDGNAHRGRHQHCHRGQRCENSWAISSCSRIGRDGLRNSIPIFTIWDCIPEKRWK